MDIFPAIDLKDGQCVRLLQGDFASATIYGADPAAQARAFADAGAAWLHVVDLGGAQTGVARQFGIIAAIAREPRLKVQVGGGLRDARGVERLFDAGIARAVVGSLAVKDPALVRGWLRRFGPERIVLAFDVRPDADGVPEILINGWQSGSRQPLWEVVESYMDVGLRTVLCTDVSRDGMLNGANHELYAALRDGWPALDVLASGGVSSLAELLALADLGVSGAIVGKALYEGRIDLAAAIREVSRAG